jgi:hypothetical protein
VKKLFTQFIKYGLISLVTYSFLFFATFFITDVVQLPANLSYLISLTLTYLLLYSLTSGFVFNKDRSKRSFSLFGLHVLIFWLLNNFLFNVLFATTNINYLLIVAINVLFFAPIRFVSLRYLVFRQ